jgi:hypothetical protein
LGWHTWDDSWYFSDWSCRFCTYNDCLDDRYQGSFPDDQLCSNWPWVAAENLVGRGRTDKKKIDRIWESRYVEKLVNGPYSAFHQVEDCDVAMRVVHHGPNPDNHSDEPYDGGNDNDFNKIQPVHIDVECKEGSLRAMSPQEAEYSAKVLLESYNTIHGEAEDDHELLSLHWIKKGVATMADGDLNQRGVDKSGYNGDWGCRSCFAKGDCVEDRYRDMYPNAKLCGDSVASLRGQQKRNIADTTAWATSFVQSLQTSPYSTLQGLGECQISIGLLSSEAPRDVAASPVATA